jgi:hypothetical protein
MKAYTILIGPRQVHMCYSWLWKTSAQKKHKVFFCLFLKDRLSTRNILRRKNKELTSYDCVLCNLQTEDRNTCTINLVNHTRASFLLSGKFPGVRKIMIPKSSTFVVLRIVSVHTQLQKGVNRIHVSICIGLLELVAAGGTSGRFS